MPLFSLLEWSLLESQSKAQGAYQIPPARRHTDFCGLIVVSLAIALLSPSASQQPLLKVAGALQTGKVVPGDWLTSLGFLLPPDLGLGDHESFMSFPVPSNRFIFTMCPAFPHVFSGRVGLYHTVNNARSQTVIFHLSVRTTPRSSHIILCLHPIGQSWIM